MKTRDENTASQVMTAAEAAKYLHIHGSTLYKLLRKRQIPFFKMGSDYRLDRVAIEKWINHRQVKI